MVHPCNPDSWAHVAILGLLRMKLAVQQTAGYLTKENKERGDLASAVSRTKILPYATSELPGNYGLESALLKMPVETGTRDPRCTPVLPQEAQCTWSSGGGRISFSRLSCSICRINSTGSVHPAPSTAGIQRARK